MKANTNKGGNTMQQPITAILHNDGSISILHWIDWASKNDLERYDAYWIEKGEITLFDALKRMNHLRIVFAKWLKST